MNKQLKACVRPVLERSIQELLVPVVERSIKIALTTCESIIKKVSNTRILQCARHTSVLVIYAQGGFCLLWVD